LESQSRPFRRTLVLWTALGVALRAGLLLLSGDLDLQSDEGNYVYLALLWNHFGVFFDAYRYLWPPGYVAFLAECLGAFGAAGLMAARWIQVLASAAIGASVMLLARRAFDERAARLAGMLWCVYLPLAAFTHTFWNETLFLATFLPALLQLLIVLQDGARARDRNVVLAALFLALALYLKELPLYYAAVLAALLFASGRRVSNVEGIRRATLFALTLAAAHLPWGLRNLEVYGRFVPVGSSLGENVYVGLNGEYRNYDLRPFASRRVGLVEALPARAWFADGPLADRWERAEEVLNAPDRFAENTRRGLAFAAEHPGWIARSRVKKLADFATPISFFVRHVALGHYAGTPLARPGLRHVLVLWAGLCPLLVLLGAGVGFFAALEDRAARWLFGSLFLYVLAATLLVAISRFRVPVIPLAIVLSAGLATRALDSAQVRRRALLPLVAFGALLGFLWWVDAPETWLVFRLALGGGA